MKYNLGRQKLSKTTGSHKNKPHTYTHRHFDPLAKNGTFWASKRVITVMNQRHQPRLPVLAMTELKVLNLPYHAATNNYKTEQNI